MNKIYESYVNIINESKNISLFNLELSGGKKHGYVYNADTTESKTNIKYGKTNVPCPQCKHTVKIDLLKQAEFGGGYTGHCDNCGREFHLFINQIKNKK